MALSPQPRGNLKTRKYQRLLSVIRAHRFHLNHLSRSQQQMKHRSNQIGHDSSAPVGP